jgi:hypothetical protein
VTTSANAAAARNSAFFMGVFSDHLLLRDPEVEWPSVSGAATTPRVSAPDLLYG